MRSRLFWLLPAGAAAPWVYAFFGGAEQPWVLGVSIAAALLLVAVAWVVRRPADRATAGAFLALAPLGVGLARFVDIQSGIAPALAVPGVDPLSRATMTAAGLSDALSPVTYGALASHALLAGLSVALLAGIGRRGRARVGPTLVAAVVIGVVGIGAFTFETPLLRLLGLAPSLALLVVAVAAARGAPRARLLRAASVAGLSLLCVMVVIEAATNGAHLRYLSNVSVALGAPGWTSVLDSLLPRARAIAVAPWLAIALIAACGVGYLSRGRALRRLRLFAPVWLLGLAVIAGHGAAMRTVSATAAESHEPLRLDFAVPAVDVHPLYVADVGLRIWADGATVGSGPAEGYVAVESGARWSEVLEALARVAPEATSLELLVRSSPPPDRALLRRVLPYVADVYDGWQYSSVQVWLCPEGNADYPYPRDVYRPAEGEVIDEVVAAIAADPAACVR